MHLDILERSGLVFCERFDEKSDIWITQKHKHDYLELMYFIKGGAFIEGENSFVSVSVHDVVIYPENYAHNETVDFTKPQEIVCLWVDSRNYSGIADMVTLTDYDNRLQWIFVEIHRQFLMRKNSVVRELMKLLFLYIQEHCEKGLTPNQSLTEKVRQYIHNHFTEKITQQDLCDIANVSASYLDRVFKHTTGKTPMDYINSMRTKAAADLLARKEFTIERISEEVGISDPKYFSRVFKKYTGLSPKQYRCTRP